MSYQGINDFDASTPERTRQSLQRLNLEVDKAFLAVPREQRFKIRFVSDDTTAKFGEFLVIDTRLKAITITLPKPKTTDAGLTIGWAVRSAANQATFRCSGALINGQSSVVPTAIAAWAGRWFDVICDGADYWV